MVHTLLTSFDARPAEAINRFDYAAPAEIFMTPKRIMRRPPITYRRFTTAAEAIRFAIEELSAPLRVNVVMEVLEERFHQQAIRKLYAGTNYPLVRCAARDRKLSMQQQPW
jgi:hypothetical protein